MAVDEAALAHQLLDPLPGLAHVVTVQHDFRTVTLAGVDLRPDCRRGHDDGRVDPRLPRRPRVRLTGIAGGQRDDPRRPLAGAKRRDLRQRRADLERTGLLEVLRLQIEPIVAESRSPGGSKDRGSRRRAQDRGPLDPPLERRPGGHDPLEAHRSVEHAGSIAAADGRAAPVPEPGFGLACLRKQ